MAILYIYILFMQNQFLLTSVHTPVVLWCWVGLWIASHSQLCINGRSEPGRLTDVCVCQWVKVFWDMTPGHFKPLKEGWHFFLECWQPGTWWYCITSQKTGILYYAAAKTSELACNLCPPCLVCCKACLEK